METFRFVALLFTLQQSFRPDRQRARKGPKYGIVSLIVPLCAETGTTLYKYRQHGCTANSFSA